MSSIKRKTLVLTDEELHDIVDVCAEADCSKDELVEQLRKKLCMDLEPYNDLVKVVFSCEFALWDGGSYLMRRSWMGFMDTIAYDVEFECSVGGRYWDLAWKEMTVRCEYNLVALAKEFGPTPEPQLPDFMADLDSDRLGQFISCNERLLDKAPEDDLQVWKDVLAAQFSGWTKKWDEGEDEVAVPGRDEVVEDWTQERYDALIAAMKEAGALVQSIAPLL